MTEYGFCDRQKEKNGLIKKKTNRKTKKLQKEKRNLGKRTVFISKAPNEASVKLVDTKILFQLNVHRNKLCSRVLPDIKLFG